MGNDSDNPFFKGQQKTEIKDINFSNTIGQLEKSIDDVEIILNEEDFRDYCDNLYSCIAIIRANQNKT